MEAQSPKEALSPKLYRQMKGLDDPPDVVAMRRTLNEIMARQSRIEEQHMVIESQNTVIMEQLKMVLDIRKQVITNTEDLHATMKSLADHEFSQAQDPANYAVLKQQNSAILWGIGIIITGSLGWVVKQQLDHSSILRTLRLTETTKTARHQHLTEDIAAVKAEAHAAYEQANEVNEKIASSGPETKDHSQLKPE